MWQRRRWERVAAGAVTIGSLAIGLQSADGNDDPAVRPARQAGPALPQQEPLPEPIRIEQMGQTSAATTNHVLIAEPGTYAIAPHAHETAWSG